MNFAGKSSFINMESCYWKQRIQRCFFQLIIQMCVDTGLSSEGTFWRTADGMCADTHVKVPCRGSKRGRGLSKGINYIR